MESINNGMNPQEKMLFGKAQEKNPGLTEEAFLELRNNALSAHSPDAKSFFKQHGFLMEEKPNPDEKSEIEENFEMS